MMADPLPNEPTPPRPQPAKHNADERHKMLTGIQQLTNRASYLAVVASYKEGGGFVHGQYGSLRCGSLEAMQVCARLLNAAKATVAHIVADLILPAMVKAGNVVTLDGLLAKVNELVERDEGTQAFFGPDPSTLTQDEVAAVEAKDAVIAAKQTH